MRYLLIIIFILPRLITNGQSIIHDIANLEETLLNASSGDIIQISDGVYCQDLYLNAIGKENDSIVIQPVNDFKVKLKGKIIMTGTHLVFKNFIITNNKDSRVLTLNKLQHSRITNNRFTNCGNDSSTDATLKVIGNSSFNKIDNNIWDNTKSRCISIKPPSKYTTIARNKFINTPKANRNKWEVIQINNNSKQQDSSLYVYILNNLFVNYLGDMAEVISVKCSNNYIGKNLFYNCKGDVTLRRGNSNFVYENVFIKSSGIRISGYNHKIIGNYLFDDDKHLIKVMSGDSLNNQYEKANYCSIVDNSIFSNKNSPIILGYGYNVKKNIINRPIEIFFFNNKIYCKSDLNIIEYAYGEYEGIYSILDFNKINEIRNFEYNKEMEDYYKYFIRKMGINKFIKSDTLSFINN